MNDVFNQHEYQHKQIALIGYGVTGKACAEYLLKKNAVVNVFDKEVHRPNDNEDTDPNLRFFSLNENTQLQSFDIVVVSPGVNLNQSFIKRYMQSGKKVIGDVELFARENKVPVLAVTGSNGKSTVVDMLAQCLKASGYKVGLGGNFGNSALEMLNCNYDFIVLELSSFQLESTFSLHPLISCVLNVTPDHMDRHGTMTEYTRVKQTIYEQATHVIFNRDDESTYPSSLVNSTVSSIGSANPALHTSQTAKCHFYQTNDGVFLHEQKIMSANKIKNTSAYQMLNMQAVLACACLLNIDMSLFVKTLYAYEGLAHRFELVHKSPSCLWINDSKATNPGAALAAITSLAQKNVRIILIAGGDGKGADMSLVNAAIVKHVELLVLIGKDKDLFSELGVAFQYAKDLPEAVNIANAHLIDTEGTSEEQKNITEPQVAVLLSPACASIDMFANYQERGNIFMESVLALVRA